MFRTCARFLTMMLSFALLAGSPAAAQVIASTNASNSDMAYRLGSGDKVRVTVYNEEMLSGEYEVDGSGNLSLQLIGTINAAGKSVPEVIAEIQSKLKEGYMKNPSVAVEVLNYRPFYVMGEVKEPGKYPYVSGMTVLNAIALAGGHTYRGKKGRSFVIRADDPNRKEVRAEDNALIKPGDIVRIPERVF